MIDPVGDSDLGHRWSGSPHKRLFSNSFRPMPSISFFLSTSDHPIDEDHPLWHCPLPDNRLHQVKIPVTDGLDAVTYGDYFSAIASFCAASGWTRMVKAISRQSDQPLSQKDLGGLSVFLEKHGAFYHPARLQVTVKDRMLSFVINVATSLPGRRAMSREIKALAHINAQRPFGWFPEVYDHTSAMLPMFLGDWFDGFHEFHLTRQDDSEEPAIVVWDGAPARSLLSEERVADLYRNATMILTTCYDPITTCQIFPWHHAAGDFVVRVEAEHTTVRLITVRDYVPMPGWEAEPDDERSLLEALMFFFIHLSARMRLDRLDGVGNVVWAPGRCLAPMADGFFKGLDLTARLSGLPDTFPDAFRQFFSRLDRPTLSAVARRVAETFFDEQTEERRLIDHHLVRHVHDIRQLLTA